MMRRISALLVLFALTGCAAMIPTTSTLNDFVMAGIKSNSQEQVVLEFRSEVMDGTMGKFTHTEASTFRFMLMEYMRNKFVHMEIGYAGEEVGKKTRIQVVLTDFKIGSSSLDNAAEQFVAGFFGGNMDYMLSSRVAVTLAIHRQGETLTKVITGTSETAYSGKSNQGKVAAMTHARNINAANNKVLMLMNAYFEELGL